MCDVSHNWSTPTDLPSNGARSIVFMGGQPFCSLYSSPLKLGKMPRSVQINPRRRTEASLITACGTAHRHLPASQTCPDHPDSQTTPHHGLSAHANSGRDVPGPSWWPATRFMPMASRSGSTAIPGETATDGCILAAKR